MTCLYSLYDALVSIHVPADKARAVVDAMERGMNTTLATKSDIDALRLATKSDIDALRVATKSDVDALRVATKSDMTILQKDFEAKYLLLRQEFESTRISLRQDIEASRNKTIIWLGSALVVASSSVVAAVRLL